MKIQLFLALTACTFLGADADKANKAEDDLKQMQGDWKIDSIEADGQNVTNDLVNDVLSEVVVRVDKDRMSLVKAGAKEIVGTTMTLSPEATPKAADFKPNEDAFGVFNGESMWGIYELSKEQLKICVSTNTAMKQRPIEFKTQPGSSVYLVVLKRP